MSNLFIKETLVNRDLDTVFSENLYETHHDDKNELYHALVKEYGRCTGKVYVELSTGTKAIGWVFVKRNQYSDSKNTYLQETLIEVYESEPAIIYNYA